MYTYFTTLNSDEEDISTVECHLCGEVFDINFETLDNVYYNDEEFGYYIICPSCGQRGAY